MSGPVLASRCRSCAVPMVPARTARAEGVPIGHRRHDGRGLCTPCYGVARRADALADHERLTRSSDDLLDDWALLRGQGHPVDVIAERLGMTRVGLLHGVRRGRRAGDRRAA